MVTTRSCKAKGRRLQQYVAKELLKTYNKRNVFYSDYAIDNGLLWGMVKFEPDDIKSTTMGISGTDVQLSPLAKGIIPFDIECKNQEKWNIPNWWTQCTQNTGKGRSPLLIVSKNRSEKLAILKLEDLFNMIKTPLV